MLIIGSLISASVTFPDVNDSRGTEGGGEGGERDTEHTILSLSFFILKVSFLHLLSFYYLVL